MQFNIVFRNWLNSQKISDKVLEDFGIYGENEIVFPVYDMNGDFIFNKYRRSPLTDNGMKYWYDKGSKVTLYGGYKVKDSTTILITEGERDCLVAWSHNIPAVTSTGGAMSFQEEWKDFFTNKEVILCFDNDQAGGDGMVKTLKYMPHAKIMFLPDRANLKDITDYVVGGGDLTALLKTAKHFKDITDVKEDMLNRIASFQSVYFHEAYIKEHTKNNTKYEIKTFSNDKITDVKQYPIPSLLEFNKHKKAKCLWHNDSNPSLHYFPKTNTCYCFSCNKVADSIDVYMKLHNCTFKEAVANLKKLI